MIILLNLCNAISKFLPTRFIKHVYDLISILVSFLISVYIVGFREPRELISDIIFIFIYSEVLTYLMGIHRHLWRFTSIDNVIDTVKYSCYLSTGYVLWSFVSAGFSESLIKVFILLFVLSFVFLNFLRIIIRLAYEQSKIIRNTDQLKVILIGAGKGGELFLRETKKRTGDTYKVEAVLDDNPELWGKKLFGAKVHGPLKDLYKLSRSGDIDMVVIAIPSLNREKLFELTKIGEDCNLQVRVLPSFDKLLLMGSPISPENISMEDLLGRDSVTLETQEVLNFIQNKTILITGAGGSIGSEICRQLVALEPKKVILIDHSEYNLYNIGWELEHTYHYKNFESMLINVSDRNSMELVFINHNPDVVFHAAAYKHVPLLETQILQAVQNNFFGTKTVAELSTKYKCEKFILISTDKAVNPTNIMGATKRMAEMFCQNLNRYSNTSYITVRFGNVLDSAGSVVPIFKKQLQQGGPLTVTHPDITRFFMSIPEASQLVLQAAAMGEGGEIFVLDMGQPIKISSLAERIITLSGQRPYKDIDIIFTGLRPGEKLYEELFYQSENHNPTQRKKIFLAQSKTSNFSFLKEKIETLENTLTSKDEVKVLKIICEIVPEAKIACI